jgi:pheromone shutdown-related protein TraB
MEDTPPDTEPERTPDSDIHRLDVGDREIILIGTAHISRHSVRLVEELIEAEQPDTVCVELDESRLQSLRNDDQWQDLDVIEIIRQNKLTFLIARLILTSFQKRMGGMTGVKPGTEMLKAVDLADEYGLDVQLVDRDVQITLLRAWRTTPWLNRLQLAATLFLSIFDQTEIDEEDLSDLRQQHNLTDILDELGTSLPQLKTALVDERDQYMASGIDDAEGDKVLAVVGAAHIGGIKDYLESGTDEIDRAELEEVPPKSEWTSLIPWIIPAVVIGLFTWGYFHGDYEKLRRAAFAWVFANGVLSSLGTLIAKGHPITVLSAFVAAPLTSLNPTIGAGMATAFVQAIFAPPKVRDLETIGEDVANLAGWWSNKLGRIMTVFVFSSIGSAIGTFVAFGWLKELL